MRNNDISDFLQIFERRIFFDIASNGCGNGCVYCFTKNPAAPQELLDIEEIDRLCLEAFSIISGKNTILSLCPNTEPMKSEQSRSLIFRVIQFFIDKVDYIQISTKEEIPPDYLDQLNSVALKNGQIRISVSLPYLSQASVIEPGAASVEARLRNLAAVKRFHKLLFILYLRPFNRQMLIEKNKYADIIHTYSPDEICLGAEYVRKVEAGQLCTFMYDNNLSENIFKSTDLESIFEFADFLRSQTGSKIFYSSVCCIANRGGYGCVLKLYEHNSEYCKDCTLNLVSVRKQEACGSF